MTAVCSRRALLGASGVAVGLALGAPLARAATPGPNGDPALLAGALTLERLAVLGYEQLLAGGWLRGHDLELVREILVQERAHAATITSYLVEIAAPVPRAPRSAADLEAAIPGLGAVASAPAALRYAAALEELSVFAYHSSVPGLSDDKLVQVAAAVMCDEGQHLALLRERLGLDPAPAALAVGALHPMG